MIEDGCLRPHTYTMIEAWWPEAPHLHNDRAYGGLRPHSYIMTRHGGLRPHSYIMIEHGGLRPHTYTMIDMVA